MKLAKITGTLGEIAKAKQMLHGARMEIARALRAKDITAALKARAVGEAILALSQTIEHGKDLAHEAGELIVDADCARSKLEAVDLAARKTTGGRPVKREHDVPLSKTERVQQIRRAPLAELPETDKTAYFDAVRKEGRPPTTGEAARFASLEPKQRTRVLAKLGDGVDIAKALREGEREGKRQERVDKLERIARGNAPITDIAEKFPVIYADPPWRYEHAESESRAIENQYPTMSLDEIKALDVGHITTVDAILFLWATSPKLAEAMEVLTAWGFVYRTCIVWDKEKIGMGYYARQQHELLLIATKGAPPVPAPAARPASVYREARDPKHSAKPAYFYGMIETMYPTLPKIELFCRSPREGWAAWGNQSEAPAA